jgi:hypothetical protein
MDWSAGKLVRQHFEEDTAALRKRGGLKLNCGRGFRPKLPKPQGASATGPPCVQRRRGLLFMRLFERGGNLPGTICPALLPIRHNRWRPHQGVLPASAPKLALGRRYKRKSPAAEQYAAGDYLDEHLGWPSAQVV